MHKRPQLIAGAIVATALIAIAAACGAAFASDDGSAGRPTTTLHFLLRETQQVIDRAPAGPSNGDVVLVRGELLNPNTRKPVGTEVGSYVMVDAANENRSPAQIVFTPGARSSLAQADQITTAGIFDSVPSKVVSAITGGTGRYQNVHGQVVGKQGPDGLVDVVIHIRMS
jgi:predicted aconitase with swiveling domain